MDARDSGGWDIQQADDLPPDRLGDGDQVPRPPDAAEELSVVGPDPVSGVPLGIAKDAEVVDREHGWQIDVQRQEVRLVVEVVAAPGDERFQLALARLPRPYGTAEHRIATRRPAA